jgi:hypothetical protein
VDGVFSMVGEESGEYREGRVLLNRDGAVLPWQAHPDSEREFFSLQLEVADTLDGERAFALGHWWDEPGQWQMAVFDTSAGELISMVPVPVQADSLEFALIMVDGQPRYHLVGDLQALDQSGQVVRRYLAVVGADGTLLPY